LGSTKQKNNYVNLSDSNVLKNNFKNYILNCTLDINKSNLTLHLKNKIIDWKTFLKYAGYFHRNKNMHILMLYFNADHYYFASLYSPRYKHLWASTKYLEFTENLLKYSSSNFRLFCTETDNKYYLRYNKYSNLTPPNASRLSKNIFYLPEETRLFWWEIDAEIWFLHSFSRRMNAFSRVKTATQNTRSVGIEHPGNILNILHNRYLDISYDFFLDYYDSVHSDPFYESVYRDFYLRRIQIENK